MEYIIIDKDNVIRDISSLQSNLGVGYTFPGATTLKTALPSDITIGDTYDPDAKTFTQDKAARDKKALERQIEQLIQQEIRAMAVSNLKARGALPADYKIIAAEEIGK